MMLTMNYYILLFIFYCARLAISLENYCDNWESYKEEKCIKLINNVSLQSFSDAEKTCVLNENSQLISIHSHDDQTFLENYLFKKKVVVDNIWLGAKSDNTHVFHWKDGRSLVFTNWAPNNPKLLSTTENCLQMNSDELVKGKWANEPCSKKNLVVCERKQKWTLEKMQEVIEKLQKENGKLHGAVEKFQEIIKENKEENEKVQKNLEKITKNPVPIGFIYAQLPKEKSPQEIWSNEMKWTDISEQYDSTFFRVAGHKSALFGAVQDEFYPHIDKVSYYCQGNTNANSECSYVTQVQIPQKGGWAGDLYTVRHYKGDGNYSESINFHFIGGEVRPKNMAVKVWKRTA